MDAFKHMAVLTPQLSGTISPGSARKTSVPKINYFHSWGTQSKKHKLQSSVSSLGQCWLALISILQVGNAAPKQPSTTSGCTSTRVSIVRHPWPGRLQSPREDIQQGGHRASSSQFMTALELPIQTGQMWLMAIVAHGFCSLAGHCLLEI